MELRTLLSLRSPVKPIPSSEPHLFCFIPSSEHFKDPACSKLRMSFSKSPTKTNAARKMRSTESPVTLLQDAWTGRVRRPFWRRESCGVLLSRVFV